jgi:hypothetical protein
MTTAQLGIYQQLFRSRRVDYPDLPKCEGKGLSGLEIRECGRLSAVILPPFRKHTVVKSARELYLNSKRENDITYAKVKNEAPKINIIPTKKISCQGCRGHVKGPSKKSESKTHREQETIQNSGHHEFVNAIRKES